MFAIAFSIISITTGIFLNYGFGLIMVVLSFPAPFHGADKVLGYGLAVAALWYFGGLLRRLRNGTAGVKPVEDFVDPPSTRQP